MEDLLRSAALSTPDPERAFKNLLSFCENNPADDNIEKLKTNLQSIAMLFSYSQFLSNFCISNPDTLFDTLNDITSPLNKEYLYSSLTSRVKDGHEHMSVVRKFKKKETLRITFRDILKKVDLTEVMLELSMLADVIVDVSLEVVRKSLNETYGEPEEDSFAVISLGKLGSEELNFSSDVDLLFVYGPENRETSGIKTPHGIITNRISNHEYYCRLGENLLRFLSMNTEDSFVYRVDLRLRPEGQRGSIALSLSGYETYYEAWGRAWERAMLLRARHVAGDSKLGDEFLEMIRPFVYRRYLDYGAIDEIRQIKTRIDSAFKKDDIKRGYGGIREIEFFIHALQLIYGGKEPLLRERVTQKALHRLLQKNIIGQGDYSILLENYRFLRTLEHRLQQLNDLQTHAIPSDEDELYSLGKKMGFIDGRSFLAELESRRKDVRTIYDSLFREDKKEQSESTILFDEELTDIELKEYLGKKGVKDIDKGMRNIQHIRDATHYFQTLRGRRILSEILPVFAGAAIESSNPDTALNHLQSFASLLSYQESYLDLFKENKDLIQIIIGLFAQSEYLSKAIIRKPDYLELVQELVFKKPLRTLKNDLKDSMKGGQSISDAIRHAKQIEELRLGLLFLQKKIDVIELIKGLNKTAEAILSVSLEQLGGKLAVIGFGKLGGREITFNSDMDMIFVTSGGVTEEDTKIAERLLRLLISYTREGIAYRVDMRLRPDGTKGPLVSSINSFQGYYSKSAAFWEFQALLKARPLGGDIITGLAFVDMAKDILVKQGSTISASDARAMRERIQKELAREAEGYDIKLGYGGLEELEFTVQYLQLRNCNRHPILLVQGTLNAVERLKNAGVIKESEAGLLKSSYIFYRTIESYLRLREKDILKKSDTDILDSLSKFLGVKDREELIRRLEGTREMVRKIYDQQVR